MGEFFGRAAELAALRTAVMRGLQRGRAGAIVLEGDAGSGKTRLLRELLVRVADHPHVSVACYEPERRLPLALGRTLADALSNASSAAAECLAEFHLSETGAAPAWARRYEAVHRAVSVAAPVVIAVDDVQWCDEESIALLHYVMRGAAHEGHALALVLSGRSASPLASLASSLQRLLDTDFLDLTLGPLESSAAAALVHSLDPALGPGRARQVAERAGCSPFWCEMLTTAIGHPERIQELVEQRLRGRSADAAGALAIVVAMGRPIAATAVAEIQQWPEDRAVAAVDELVDAGLVVRTGAHVRISHDLLCAEVAEQAPVPPDAHRLIAAWLEERAGDDVDRLLAAAGHLRRAGASPGMVLRRALTSPLRRMIGPKALPALVAAVDDVAPDDPASIALAGGVATVAAELGDHMLALDRWVRAAARLPDKADRARAWLGASEAAQHLEQRREARRYVDLARSVAPDDPVLGLEVDAAEAHVLRWLENAAAASATLTTSALQRARALSNGREPDNLDPSLRRVYIKTLEMACVDAMQRDAAEEILPLAEELTDVAAAADVRASVQARLRGGSALMLVGRFHDAAGVLAGAWSDARRAFLVDLVLEVGSWLTWTYHLLGRLVDAEEVAGECTAVAARTGAVTRPAIMARQWRSIVAISRGEGHSAIEQLRTMAAAEADAHHRIWLREYVATWLARLDGAAAAGAVDEQVRAGAADAEAAGCARCRTQFALAAAEALARVGRPGDAEKWFASEAAAARNELQQWWVTRAAAAVSVARDSDPVAALQQALTVAEQLGMRLEVVWALLDLGRVLIQVDRDAAAVTLRRAAGVAEAASAVTEARLAARLLRDLGVHAWRTATPDHEPFEGLSPREREITALVAQGASNVDIARTLFVSRKTVERHLSNIFAKVGVRNRVQLAARVSSQHSTTTQRPAGTVET